MLSLRFLPPRSGSNGLKSLWNRISMHPHITLLLPNQTTSLFFFFFFFFSVSPVKPLKLTLLNRRALVGHSTLGTRKPLSGSPRNRLPVAGEPAQALAMAGTVVVFDFDRTIIDGDSDSWVINEMGVSELFSELRSTMPWNSLMVRTISFSFLFFFSLFLIYYDICLYQFGLLIKIVQYFVIAEKIGNLDVCFNFLLTWKIGSLRFWVSNSFSMLCFSLLSFTHIMFFSFLACSDYGYGNK